MTDDPNSSEESVDYRHQRGLDHFKEIDAEIGRLALT